MPDSLFLWATIHRNYHIIKKNCLLPEVVILVNSSQRPEVYLQGLLPTVGPYWGVMLSNSHRFKNYAKGLLKSCGPPQQYIGDTGQFLWT